MKELNTMESFLDEGFKIERNGTIIILTRDEMSDFRYLDKAATGKNCLEAYMDWVSDDEIPTIEKMMKDEEICYNIEDEILDIAMGDIGAIESEVISKYVRRNREE